jgi:glucans biosynthesis protein
MYSHTHVYAQTSAPAFIPQTLNEGSRFEPSQVIEAARQLARKPFQALPNDLPEPLNNLSQEMYASIRALPSNMVWQGENRGMVIEPLHRGFAYTQPVALYQIDEGSIRRITFLAQNYDYTRLQEAGKAVPSTLPDLQFSGFKIRLPDANGAEAVVFQGASFFRAMGFEQTYGQMARALTLRPADARGEEFPLFRAFWLEKPSAGATTLVVHALIDSESASAAVRFTIRPNGVTIIDVEMTLFPRVTLEHVGLGASAGAFLFARHSRRLSDDIRASVHEVSALQIHTGRNEWIYRPVTNPETLLISVFSDANPKGFGLVQRDRDYKDFHDDVTPWSSRPSLWIEPLGEWGAGAIQLLEIPSDVETNDNILAYWRPKTPYIAGSEVTLAYRQYWGRQPPETAPVAQVNHTRTGRVQGTRRRRINVDFTGDAFAQATLPTNIRASLWSNAGVVSPVRLWHYPERKTVRAGFDLDPQAENNIELRLLLETPDSAKPETWNAVTETWLYRWTP